MKKNYSYTDIIELGIEVCASCGGSNINYNFDAKPADFCRDCNFSEGTHTCMPDDENFYQMAKERLKILKRG